MAKQIEGQLTQDGEIVIGMAAADARLIFPKGDIEHPMHTIFNAPMTTNRRGKAVNIAAKTEQVIARFLLHLLTNTPFGLHHANRLQALPFALFVQIAQELQVVKDPMFANFQTPVSLLNALLKVKSDVAKLLVLSQTKGIFDILLEAALILFEREHIVSFLLNDLGGNSSLGSHGINGDDASFQQEQC